MEKVELSERATVVEEKLWKAMKSIQARGVKIELGSLGDPDDLTSCCAIGAYCARNEFKKSSNGRTRFDTEAARRDLGISFGEITSIYAGFDNVTYPSADSEEFEAVGQRLRAEFCPNLG